MFWKNKWKSFNIKKKIFVVTGTLIITAFTFMYLLMYAFMPRIYNIYKTHILNNNLEILIRELESKNINDIEEELYRFGYENNSFFIIKDMNENVVFVSKGPMPKPYLAKTMDKNENVIKMKKEFYFNLLDKNCNIEVMGNYRPIDEATKALLLFVPFMIIITLVLAYILAKIYSKLISKPILDINKAAKDISEFNFSNKLEIDGEDEISELCSNLNYMSEKLESNIKKLECANAKLRDDIERERAIERQRREFIATISHELKSPLTIISGQLEGMIMNIGKFKDRDKYLGESYNVTQDMKKLVQEILSLSKLEEDKFKLYISNINLTEVLEEIIYNNNYFIVEKNITLEESLQENIWIKGDRGLIKRALNNVVSNAFKYTPQNEKVIITLNCDELLVENKGVTIEEEDLENVFKPFYRIDKSRNRKTGGSGLGLYIVKSILDRHENISYNISSKMNSVVFKMIFHDES